MEGSAGKGKSLCFRDLNKIRTFSWRQLEGDVIPDILKNIDLRGWREGLEV